VKSLFLIAATTAISVHASPGAAQPSPPVIKVGIMDDPCGALPPQPAAGTADDKRQIELRMADFFNLCRYRAANQALPPPSSTRVIFMGDSITEGWKESRPGFFQGDRIDRGISGQTSAQMLGRFYADVIALRPSVVHILVGTNDIAGNGGPTSLEAIRNNIRSMVELAQAHRIRVVLGTVPPAVRFDWRPEIEPVPSIRALNSWIRGYARSRGISLVDYYAVLDDGHHGLAKNDSADGVHPTAAGYAKMEAALEGNLGPRKH
jgi:acyl-CoA thioesterase-1